MHPANWCYAKLYFSNCKSIVASDELCKKSQLRGKCDNEHISGYITRIQMYQQEYWGSRQPENMIPVPAGFSLWTSEGKRYNFGAYEGKRAYETWEGEGRARIIGVMFDDRVPRETF